MPTIICGALGGTYDFPLVIASFIVALIASFTALDLADRVRATAGRARAVWLACAAVAMGGGVWSMHFIAMLALAAPMPVDYDPTETVASLLIVMMASGVGFSVAMRRPDGWRHLLTAGLVMGLGISVMHYMGMDAMRMDNIGVAYSPLFFLLSVTIAVVAAIIGLWFAFNGLVGWRKPGAAAIIALAVSGMHYVGMSGLTLTLLENTGKPPLFDTMSTAWLGESVATVTLMLLGFGLLSSFVDRRFATQAREAADHQARQTELLVTLIDNLPIGVSIFGADKRLYAFNRPFVEIPGYSFENVKIGMPHETICPTPGFVEEERPRRFECECDNGRLVEFRHIPLPSGGFVSTRTDLTETRSMQRRLAEAERLEAVGRLSGGIAHEFNTLHGVLIGNLDEIAELAQSRRDERSIRSVIQECSSQALEAAMRAGELIHQLLAFGRNQMLEPRVLHIGGFLQVIEPRLLRYLGQAVELAFRIDPNMWMVKVDRAQLENALLALTFNARDAMPDGGKLTFVCSNVTLDQSRADAMEVKPGEYGCLAVSDTGTGIDAGLLRRVFEPFVTTKDVGEGTGLGLSMVYGFTRQSGGTAEISSALGLGTEIRLYLPRAS